MESQTPPGSKPPAKPEDTAWISPRLRDKLEDAEPGSAKGGPSPMIGIVLAVLVVGGGAALFATMRSGAAKQKVEATRRAAEAAAAAIAESTANAARVDSMRKVVAARAAAESAQAGLRPKASRPAPPSGGSAASTAGSAPAAPKPVEKGPFGLDVGSFLAEERASSELARLAAATGVQGKVVTQNEDGGEVYHVVLGSFPSRAAAEKRAEGLITKGLVSQARAVSLAP